MDLIMNSFLTFIIINICLLFGASEADLVHRRRPRALWTLGAMIECATTHSPWDFNNYGCWCGYGGGGAPVDDVDRCCRLHDECYDALVEDSSCSKWGLYVSSYLYQRRHCDDIERATITCAGEQGSGCGAGLCHCDREAVLCFARANYNGQYLGHDKDSCLP